LAGWFSAGVGRVGGLAAADPRDGLLAAESGAASGFTEAVSDKGGLAGGVFAEATFTAEAS